MYVQYNLFLSLQLSALQTYTEALKYIIYMLFQPTKTKYVLDNGGYFEEFKCKTQFCFLTPLLFPP